MSFIHPHIHHDNNLSTYTFVRNYTHTIRHARCDSVNDRIPFNASDNWWYHDDGCISSVGTCESCWDRMMNIMSICVPFMSRYGIQYKEASLWNCFWIIPGQWNSSKSYYKSNYQLEKKMKLLKGLIVGWHNGIGPVFHSHK